MSKPPADYADNDFKIYDEDRLSREDTRAKCVTWLIAGIGIGILATIYVLG